MTVAVTSSYNSALGNGSNKSFSFSFRAQSAAEVAAYVNGVLQTSGYTVALNLDANGRPTGGGTVTFTSAPANGAKVVVASSPLFTQLIAFENAGSFLPSTHDDVNDRAAIRDIYINALLARTVLVPWGESGSVLPDAATRAGKVLGFDSLTGAPMITDSTGPTGPAPNLSIGTVTGLATGATPTVTIGGTNPNYTLSFGIPAGATGLTGPTPTLTFGSVTTGAPGTSASISTVDLGGGAYRLDFTIPRGSPGASGALSDADYGDIVVSGTGAVLTVDAKAITLAKMADMATASLLGRNSGGTGSPEVLSAATVKTLLSLNNLDNTSDANKPVSTAQQAALDLKAPIDNPAFTTAVTLPGDPANPLEAATKQYVDANTNLVPTTVKTASYALVLTDQGSCITTVAGVTIPSYAQQAFPLGSIVEIFNAAGVSITLTLSGSGTTVRKHGSLTTTTTLSLPARSFGTLRKPAFTTEWVAVGFS